MSVLDDDKFHNDSEFEIKYHGYEDVYEIQVVKEWRLNIVVEGKVDGYVEIECKRNKLV